MGYLTDTSKTLTYEESKKVSSYIKEHGILQFLHLLKKFKDFTHPQDEIFWGDELELHLINIDPVTKVARLQINNGYMFEALRSEHFDLQPEYGAWMLETVPVKPYNSDGNPLPVYENFKVRRETINSHCKDGDVLFQGTVFPLLNVGDFYVPKGGIRREEDLEVDVERMSPKKRQKKTEADNAIKRMLLNPHPRYAALGDNVKARRGGDLCMLAPLYRDELTSFEKTPEEPYPGFIHMSDTLFGSGNTSLQVTFGTKNIEEARYLFDQLSVFSSIMLPLSAASAIFKGKLADTDLRWNVLGDSVDCRSAEERDSSHLNHRPKSRWSTISRYISTSPLHHESYNDIHVHTDQNMMRYAKEKAQELGLELDEQLIKHLGIIFNQDPLVIFGDKIYVDDTKVTNHFENIQSTNWNNVRFKPPPSFDSEVGWRVELRTMESQLTAEEATACSMFSYFVGTMITKKQLNFYIPISKVDENFTRAHIRNSLLTQKFWFRKDVSKDSADEWAEFTIDEILHGKEGSFVGLLNLVYEYIQEEFGVNVQEEWQKKRDDPSYQVPKVVENMRFFGILSKRAKGELPTIASWIRNFVLNHPEYNKDSIVTQRIASDLIMAMTEISDGKRTYEMIAS